MSLPPEVAVSHIINSLDNTNANYWHDPLEDVTWVVSGHDGVVIITLHNADGSEEEYIYNLVLAE